MSIYFYNAYGLSIKSDIPLPELKSVDIAFSSEVFITFHDTESYKQITGKNDEFYNANRTNSNVPVLWEGKLIFRVIAGTSIIVNSELSINEPFLRSLILGQGMAVILHQRGHLLLHASAVNMDDGAVIFLGECGFGKSTISAVLDKKGYPLLSDDVSAINFEKNRKPVIMPSFSRIKLNNDIIQHLGYQNGYFPQIHPDFEKYSFKSKNFSLDPVSIKIIYVLEKSVRNEVQSMKSSDKLINLIKNTYTQNIFETEEKVINLFKCDNLIKNVPIKRLNIFHSLCKLEELVSIVEKDILIL